MHLFTIVQIICLATLWTVKESQIALAFPFFVLLMVPFRMMLKFLPMFHFSLKPFEFWKKGPLFSDEELDAVSGVFFSNYFFL